MKNPNKEFKDAMISTGIENFKRDGFLQQALIYLIDNEFNAKPINDIDDIFFKEYEDIKNQKNFQISIMIMEGNMLKVDQNNFDLYESILDDTVKVSDMENKRDIILFFTETKDSKEYNGYYVDKETKSILREIDFSKLKQIF